LLAAVSQYANWAITFSFMPLLATRLGASEVVLSLLLSMNIGLATLGSLLAATLVSKLGARRLATGTFALASVGIALAAVAPSLTQVFVAQFLVGVGQGLGYPVLMGMSIRDVEDSQRTTAMGLHQSVYALGMFAGPWLSGIIADAIGIRPMFGVTAGATLVLALLLIRLLPSRKPQPAEPKLTAA
jgi:MFS family permease